LKRLKSRSVVTHSQPASMASAARLASGTRLPFALASAHSRQEISQCRAPGDAYSAGRGVHPGALSRLRDPAARPALPGLQDGPGRGQRQPGRALHGHRGAPLLDQPRRRRLLRGPDLTPGQAHARGHP
jgi:hypothetical protein